MRIPRAARIEAGEAWCSSWSPEGSVAEELVERLTAAMSAKASFIAGRLLPAVHTAPATEELATPS
jgi:hypothetical protein